MASSAPTTPAAAPSTLPDASQTTFAEPLGDDTGRSTCQVSSDQEAIKIVALGDSKSRTSLSLAPDPPIWTMSTRDEWIAIAACFWCVFSVGWNDATTGPLLPAFQAHYGVGFTIVSMLFVSNCVGFLSAAVINIHLTDRLGFGKIIALGAVLQVLAYSLMVPALPFPVMCVTYAINGFGIGFQDAQANGFIADLPNNASTKMGLLHAVYGAGAFISPLVATQFVQRPRWSFHYLTSLGLSVTNAIILLVVFRFRRQHEIMGLPNPISTHTQTKESQTSAPQDSGKYEEIFSSRVVQLVSFFIWVYVGLEVTIGGWIVTFIIDERGGGPSAGYISSGFFGGLMLGRVVLLWVNEKVGERRVVYFYCILCLGLELVIWLVPDLIGDAVAVSLLGLLLGKPKYPIAMNITGSIVPKRILTESIGWIASFGQAGSAVFPFMTGALAQKYTVKVLLPVVVGMVGVLVVLWALIPTGPKPREELIESKPTAGV